MTPIVSTQNQIMNTNNSDNSKNDIAATDEGAVKPVKRAVRGPRNLRRATNKPDISGAEVSPEVGVVNAATDPVLMAEVKKPRQARQPRPSRVAGEMLLEQEISSSASISADAGQNKPDAMQKPRQPRVRSENGRGENARPGESRVRPSFP